MESIPVNGTAFLLPELQARILTALTGFARKMFLIPIIRAKPLIGMVIMAGMSFSTWHSDLRLGLLLGVVALLLNAGSSGAFWVKTSSSWLDLTSVQYGLLASAGGLGALVSVAAAIWVDRSPPHGMMAAGAVLLALGPFLALSDNFVLAVTRSFFTGVGGAFVGSLIFYAVAVKGCTRFKGTLIGSLGLLFSMRWGTGAVAAWGVGLPLGWWAVAMVVSGGALVFLFLPRWFTGHYGPGLTLRQTLAVPGAKLNVAWVAAVYLVASLMVTAGATYLGWVASKLVQDGASLESNFRFIALAGGIGALLWGIAADYFPVRKLLIAMAALSLLAALSLWLPGGDGTDMLILSVVRGGLVSLPWVLMADYLPMRHFAKLALAVTWVGSMGNFLVLLVEPLGLYYWGWTLGVWGVDSFFWIVLIEVVLLVGVVTFWPKVFETVG